MFRGNRHGHHAPFVAEVWTELLIHRRSVTFILVFHIMRCLLYGHAPANFEEYYAQGLLYKEILHLLLHS